MREEETAPTAELPAALPEERGHLSHFLISKLSMPAHDIGLAPPPRDDAIEGDDFHLALYLCYELHYRSFAGVDDDWEWEPSLLAVRVGLERAFERALRDAVSVPTFPLHADMQTKLRALIAGDESPSLGLRLERDPTTERFREFMIHRSAYQLKEADPHTWTLPRLRGRAKAAMAEIQSDEYGGGRPERMHSLLFAGAMRALGLDAAYGAHLDLIPGVTLATVNLMSFLGLHRRLRGAAVGHLAAFEMTSPEPNRRYAAALQRMGYGEEATDFYLEHVEADSVHEAIAANDMAGSLAADEPVLEPQILFGAAALLFLEGRFAAHVLKAWDAKRSSLRAPQPAPAPVG